MTATKPSLRTIRLARGDARRRSLAFECAGNSQVTINNRSLEEYFPNIQDQNNVLAPLDRTESRGRVDVVIKVHGGGVSGQSGAIKLGLARALKLFDAELDDTLRHSGLLTRDGRMKERKKYGLRGARRGTQFSKR